ncbi:MAG: rod shape-determining protein MreD [Pseudomonadota bacterium]
MDRSLGYTLAWQTAYVAFAMVILLAHLVPLETTPRSLIAPDILLAMTLAWATLRPEALLIVVVGVMFLLADLLLQRPPGLWPALVIIAVEILRARSDDLRDAGFFAEWAWVSVVIVTLFVANMILSVILLPYELSEGLQLLQMAFTLLVYPLAAGLLRLMFGTQRTATGTVDGRGRPI